MDKNTYCVIMAGGVGSRFWPMSRQQKPKQFIDILGTGETLLQSTWRRATAFCAPENIVVVGNEMYESLIREQLPNALPENILSEPLRRDTAPCVAYAAYKINLKNPDAVMAVIPSDHLISKEEEFTRVMNRAFEEARTGNKLLTLGIKPTRPDTGYGYIQFDVNGGELGDGKFKPVKTFTEKPNEELANAFVTSGEFVWNSGMFVWTASSILAAFEAFQPEIISLFKEKPDAFYTPAEKEFIAKVYTQCKSISIDYGIMEKADNVWVMGAELGWSDLGTWMSLYEQLPKTPGNNAIIGKNVMTFDTKTCLVNCPNEKLVVLGSLRNLIISEYDDMLLICKKDEEQKIKHYVNEIKLSKGEKFL
ncbi:MAG: mannose-1-phosphate guanylyltransferase [Flavobacteriales bacterium]|nr:mannose-1-phosphate guanylyltransferase [Flavobacteriales bacterium]